VLYKRLANCENIDQLDLLQEELVDRFGELVDAVRALVDSHKLRILGKPLGVAKLEATSETIQLQFVAHPPLDAGKIIFMVQRNRGWKLAGPTKLRIERVTSNMQERVVAIRHVFDVLKGALPENSAEAANQAAPSRASGKPRKNKQA